MFFKSLNGQLRFPSHVYIYKLGESVCFDKMYIPPLGCGNFKDFIF